MRRDADERPGGPLIRLEGVGREFGSGATRTLALDDIDLEIERGEFLEIEGPSGCGKTTLLSVLGLLDTPDRGRYRLAGHDVTGLSPRRRAWLRNREIGFVFQSFNLIGDLSVFENVELPLTYLQLSAGERRERVESTLERFDIADRRDRRPAELSGGHQQRVAVARAVVTEPEILLADEPTGNLNSRQAESVIEMLTELHAGGATICLVSHDPRWRDIAHRTLEMFDGRLVADRAGSP